MFCVNCGSALPDGVQFCHQCGTKVGDVPNNICSNCGNKLSKGAAFCTQCGMKITGGHVANTTIYGMAAQPVEDAEYNYKRGRECLDGKVFNNAFKYFQTAAGQGHVEAQYLLAEMYKYGLGVSKSGKHATKWYAIAAKQGYAAAQYMLYRRYGDEEAGFEEVNIDEKDEEAANAAIKKTTEKAREAERWLMLSAEQGFVDALYELGKHYDRGEDFAGVPQNFEKARELYMKAISQGSEEASLNLAALDFRIEAAAATFAHDQKSFMDAIIGFFQKITPLLEKKQVFRESVYIIGVSPNFEKEMQGAFTYARLGMDEIPLIIIGGNTLLGNTVGALFTTRAVHYKNSSKDQGIIPYSNVQSSFINVWQNSYHITINRKEVGYSIKRKEAAIQVRKMLDCLIYSINHLQDAGAPTI